MTKNNNGERYIGTAKDISYSKVHDFFEERSRNDNYKHKYNYVMYLDDTPDVAMTGSPTRSSLRSFSRSVEK